MILCVCLRDALKKTFLMLVKICVHDNNPITCYSCEDANSDLIVKKNETGKVPLNSSLRETGTF